MAVEIHRIPFISTAHLTQDVADMFTQQGDDNPWCPCAGFEYGYFLFLDALENDDTVETPRCLIDIRDWLSSQEEAGVVFNSRWVRLDRDAAPVPGLPTYDW